MADMKLELDQSLEQRIAEFKNDPEKMKDVNEFLNDLFQSATVEAEKRQSEKQKGRLDILGFNSKYLPAQNFKARKYESMLQMEAKELGLGTIGLEVSLIEYLLQYAIAPIPFAT